MLYLHLPFLFLFFLLDACLSIQPIHMRDMEVLSFYRDGMTGTLRGQAIPQMVLVTPYVPEDTIPKEIICKNIGWDGLNVHWDCTADMKEDWGITNPTISCEGWTGPGDEYVVPGSCSISYSIEHHPKMKEEPTRKQEAPKRETSEGPGREYRSRREENEESKYFRQPFNRAFYNNDNKKDHEDDDDIWSYLEDSWKIIFNVFKWGFGSFSFLMAVSIFCILGVCRCVRRCVRANQRGEKEGKKEKIDDGEKRREKEDVTEEKKKIEKHFHALSYSR